MDPAGRLEGEEEEEEKEGEVVEKEGGEMCVHVCYGEVSSVNSKFDTKENKAKYEAESDAQIGQLAQRERSEEKEEEGEQEEEEEKVEEEKDEGEYDEENDVVDYDFLKLKLRHKMRGGKEVPGWMLVTPRSFIFDPSSPDPLDQLEPELFQVAAPTTRIVSAKLVYSYFPRHGEEDQGYSEAIYRPDMDTGGEEEEEEEELTLYERISHGYSSGEEEGDIDEEEEVEKQVEPTLSYITVVEDTIDNDSEHYIHENSRKWNIEKRKKTFKDKQGLLYLHFTMDNSHRPDDRVYISSYGDQTLLRNYWWIVAQSQAAPLHNFLTTWLGPAYHHQPPSLPPGVQDDSIHISSNVSELHFESDHFPRPSNVVQDLYTNITTGPEMEEESTLLSKQQVEDLTLLLPPRCVGHPWTLTFSTARDGYSLLSLYRSCSSTECPCLLVIRETHSQTILGAMLSHTPRRSEIFYGTGESWLFTYCSGSLSTYPWTGSNSYILRCSAQSLVIGSDSGGFGLWLDQDLRHGSSKAVETFNNQQLATHQDFTVESLELWTFL